MNAIFTTEQYTINNRTVYLNYITTNHRDLTMVYSNKYPIIFIEWRIDALQKDVGVFVRYFVFGR